jgi:hypothetical protein
MEKYTKGTGGGSGHPENFNDWQARDPEWVTSYLNDQFCNLFLSVVHMWSKEYSDILVKTVGTVPLFSQVDDELDFDSNEDGFMLHRHMTPKSGATLSARKQSNMVAAMRDMATNRKAMTSDSNELATSVNKLVNLVGTRASSSSLGKASSTRCVIDNINDAENTIDRFERKITILKKKRNKASNNSKKLLNINAKIKRARNIVANLEIAMESYSKQLETVAGGEIANNKSGDEGMEINNNNQSSSDAITEEGGGDDSDGGRDVDDESDESGSE